MPSKSILLAIPPLLLLSALSINAVMLQPGRSGYSQVIEDLMTTSEPAYLPAPPGTKDRRLLLRHYTGYTGLDELLALLNIVFANTTDWSCPEFSLYSVHFAGQAIALFCVFYVEGLRKAASWTFILYPFSAVWGMLSQVNGYTNAVPIWAIVHLLSVASRDVPTVDKVRLRDSAQVKALTPAFALGFIVPTIAAAIPFENADHVQIANAVWQFFPLWVYLLSLGFSYLYRDGSSSSPSPLGTATKKDLAALQSFYSFGIFCAALFQWVTFAVIAAAAIKPDLFPAGMASRFTSSRVFLPVTYYSNARVADVAQIVHDIFKWDQWLGSSSALIWAAVIRAHDSPASKARGFAATVSLILRDCVLFGPGGALLRVMRERDEAVLRAVPQSKKRQ